MLLYVIVLHTSPVVGLLQWILLARNLLQITMMCVLFTILSGFSVHAILMCTCYQIAHSAWLTMWWTGTATACLPRSRRGTCPLMFFMTAHGARGARSRHHHRLATHLQVGGEAGIQDDAGCQPARDKKLWFVQIMLFLLRLMHMIWLGIWRSVTVRVIGRWFSICTLVSIRTLQGRISRSPISLKNIWMNKWMRYVHDICSCSNESTLCALHFNKTCTYGRVEC